jgi:hypothetical protein
MRRILPFAVAWLAVLLAPTTASATLYGVESNGEFINSDRTLAQQEAALDKVVAQGGDVVRVNVGWNDVAGSCTGQSPADLRNPDNPCYSWGVIDNLVQAANTRRVLVLATVSRAPEWLQGSTDPFFLGTTNSQFARSVDHFSAFMGALAERYRTGSTHGFIRMYTVWNEPNSSNYFKPMTTAYLRSLAPRRYALLYARSAIAIKLANPDAQVAIGPTNPTGNPSGRPPGIAPLTFMAGVQRALPAMLPGTGSFERRYLSAWAHNPYPGIGTAPSRGTMRAPQVGMANVRDLFVQLDRAPVTRGLRVWATEFGYQTNPPDRTLGIPAGLQGRFAAESFDWLDSTGRIPVQIWYGLTDPVQLSDWQSGTYYSSGRAKSSVLWWRRPISVPVTSVRYGTRVRVWARSNVSPTATRIAISYDGRRWRLLAISGRRGDGTLITLVPITRRTWFATWDGTRGPARVVGVR